MRYNCINKNIAFWIQQIWVELINSFDTKLLFSFGLNVLVMEFFKSPQPFELVVIASVKVSWEVIVSILIERMVRYYDTFCIRQIYKQNKFDDKYYNWLTVILEHQAFTLVQKLDEVLPVQVFVYLVGDIRKFLLYLLILFFTYVNNFQWWIPDFSVFSMKMEEHG